MTARWFRRLKLMLLLAILGSQAALASSPSHLSQPHSRRAPRINHQANHDLFVAVLSNNNIDNNELANTIEKIDSSLAAGANLEAKDTNGMTVLHYACLRKDLQIISYLINCGAQAKTRSATLSTALHYLFLEVNCALVDESSAIIQTKYERKEIARKAAKILIAHGADMLARNANDDLAGDFLRDHFLETELLKLQNL